MYIYDEPREGIPPEDAGEVACSNEDLHWVGPEVVEASEYAIETPGYLPPGTVEPESTWGTACPDGAFVLISRKFRVGESGAEIIILRYVGTKAVLYRVPAQRVRAGAISGKAAAFIEPVTPEGYRSAAVLVSDSFGVTQVGGIRLPLEELVKVAESL